jgi:AbrB family looped-hinge helix DNA binding protein
MSTMATTKLSSKGQVVIPEEIRGKMKLESGSQFLVYAQGDTVFLKLVTAPSKDELNKMMAKARAAAKKAGLTQYDVEEEIKAYRRSKKKSSKS